MTLILYILAAISFILAIAGVLRINWVAFGLLLIVIAWILPLVGASS